MNLLTLTGNLGKDAEVRNAGGTPVCGFPVAMTAGYGDKKQTVWLDCSVWGKQAEGALPGYLKKGQQVAVSGELSTREHEGKTYLQLRVNTVDLIGKRDEGGSAPTPQAQSRPAPAARQAPQEPADSYDDDIPF